MNSPSRTILIIDDSAADRELYRRYLMADRDYRYTILDAELGRQGLDLWRQHQPDAVLLDYRLPDCDGLRVLSQIQEFFPQENSLPVVVVTGLGNEAIAVALMKAGAQDYLVKGQVTPERLQRTIQNVIETTQLHHQMQQQRAESERFYTSIANLSPVGIFRSDRNGYDTYVNECCCEMMGLTAAESLDLNWVRALHPDDRERVLQQWWQLIQKNVPFRAEYRFQHADGTVRWVLGQASPETNEEGEVIGYIGTLTDLSDRKQAEQSLLESQERLHLGMLVAGFGLAKFDYATNTVELSPEAASLYGFSPDELIISRNQIHATFHPEERQELEQVIQQVLDPGGPGWFARDHRVVWPNGEVRWLNVRKQIFFSQDESPKPTHAILVAIDVSDRVHFERDRERILQQEQVAREEAERANRIKDEFLAVLSHELRSPLNPILGWTKLMQSRQFDPIETTAALATIERSVKVQMQLIDDLLDVAKILRGKLNMTVAPVNLMVIIQAAIETISTAALAKSITVNPIFSFPNVQVRGDAARLQQIVWNLLSNAIKFTPEQGQVEIRLEQVGNRVQITVSDTGKGINPEFLPYIFESFRQEDVSTTRRFGGLGLGLAIVRTLVEAHGGTIWADSLGEEQGATFTVQLPFLSVISEPIPIPQPDVESDFDLTGLRVLTVDDDPDVRELLTAILQQFGAEVLTTASGTEALSVLEAFQPDVLVSDIGMPEMDGYGLMEQIRTLPFCQERPLPAIALTAYARQEDQDRAVSEGFQQHLSKPIEPRQLIQAVSRCVRTG